MKIIDISLKLSPELAAYKDRGNKRIKIVWEKNSGKDYSTDSNLIMNSHTGTHIDAPKHFIRNGKSVDKIKLDSVVGECQVIDLTHVDNKITEQNLKHRIVSEKVLLKTKNDYGKRFNPKFIYLDESGAKYLCEQKVKLVGIDYLGLERNQECHESHKILLRKDIVILEGIDLKKVKQGKYFLAALPLYVKDAEAAPTRAVLIKGYK